MLQNVPPVTYVDTGEKMMKFVRHVRDTKECAQDTETTGLDRARDRIVLWSACPDEKSIYVFTPEMLKIYDKELAKDPKIKWYYTNQTFDFCMLDSSGHLVPVGDSYCTLAMDWLHNENEGHGLKETAWRYLGLSMPSFKDTFPGRKRKEPMYERLLRGMKEDFDNTVAYAGCDAWATFRVFHYLKKSLESQHSTQGMCYWDYFQETEAPFTRVLFEMIRRGIMIDMGHLLDIRPNIEDRLTDLQKQINKLAGKQINPRSPIQLVDLLFGDLGHEPVYYTSGGDSGNRQPSTDEGVLKTLAGRGCPVSKLLLEHRTLTKFLGTYVDGLRKWADEELRIHPTLTQHVAVTGRLSSTDPNLQNIPRPDNDEFGIRGAFIPRPGYIFIVADLCQAEARVMAHFSGDKNMQRVIKEGKDLWTGTASLMFGVPYDDINAAIKRKKRAADDATIKLTEKEKEYCFDRQAAKVIGLALNYGEGPRALAEQLGVSVEKAKELVERYFEPYPSVKEHIRYIKRLARTGMIETLLGRPRRFPELKSLGQYEWHELSGNERVAVARSERQAGNAEIQGTVADWMRKAMIKCEYDPGMKELGCEMLLQVHDELIFEVPIENADAAIPLVRENMEHPLDFELDVPIQADIGTGFSWSSAKA